MRLESGVVLKNPVIAYQTFGQLSQDRDNVIWIFHALTANSNPMEWWPGLVGEGCLFNPEKHYIICANMLGSCYGSTGAADTNPDTGVKYGIDFPEITVGDIVSTLQQLQHHLGIKQI
jgi:homoserine O-acetyltransferase